MGVLSGPFKIVLQAVERIAAPDTLGDPAAARVRNELGRLFQLDEETASNIVSAMPIVIMDGLDVRTAGVVRERLQVLRDAGCKVVVTDEVTDTIPRVNWPQLPPIARVEPSTDPSREARGASPERADGLACPHCGGGLQLVAGGAPRGGPPSGPFVNGREPEPAPAREPTRSAPTRAEADDWLSPPVGTVAVPSSSSAQAAPVASDPRSAPPPSFAPPSFAPPSPAPTASPPTASRRPSGRFDDAALLGFRQADRSDDAVGRHARTPAAAPEATPSEVLEVSFSDSGELEPAFVEQLRRPTTPVDLDVPSRGGAEPEFDEVSLLDSDDGFDGPPARARSRSTSTAASRPPAEAARPARARAADPFEDSLAGLDAPVAPAGAPASSSSRADHADPFASPPSARSDAFSSSPPSRSVPSGRASVTPDPFEDSRVLDDLSGLSGISAGDLESGSGSADPLEDSGSDILDEPPPHRRSDAGRRGGKVRFDSDLDVLEGAADLGASDEFDPPAAPSARGSGSRGSSSRDLLDDDDALQLLDSDERGPAPAARRKGSSRGGRAPDLDDVLDMFGPEDDAPLDDGSGLEPAPLDLSPPGRPTSRPAKGGGRAFDAELSDILEPLDPGEALEIIKTSKPGRRTSEAGRPATSNGRHDEPSGLEQLDLSEAGAMLAEAKQDRRSAKKSRGVPFPASDEDVGLFEENSRSSRPQKKKTDPFARARGRMQEEEDRDRDRRSGADRAGSDRGGERAERGHDRGGERSDRVERRSDPQASGAQERSRPDPRGSKRPPAGPAPSGGGDHGLVLSRIADPDKKEQAAEIIAEVKSCNLDEARRLTDRTIIPVLKGVSREVAEFHLEKFKRVKIAGRVTTRQRG